MAEFIVMHGIRVCKDFTPETFGRLTTIGPKFMLPFGSRGWSRSYQVCECGCGNVTVVQQCALKSGNTQSCGCFHKQQITKHGFSGIPEYASWTAMKDRCGNAKNRSYADYGGRGIRVCDRWLDPENGFMNFYSDMGPRPSDKHSIDRIDNDGNYFLENCRWTTRTEQCRNRRSNVMLTHNGKTQCVKDWEEELNLNRSTVRNRLKAGWTFDEISRNTHPASRKSV